jgi:hypothetical protein
MSNDEYSVMGGWYMCWDINNAIFWSILEMKVAEDGAILT